MTSCNPGHWSNTTSFNLFSQLPCVRLPPNSGMLSASCCLHFIPRMHTSRSMILFNVCLSLLSLPPLSERGFQECGGLVFLIDIFHIYTWYTEGTKQIIVIYRININAKCSLIILRQAKLNKHSGY